MFNEFRVYSKNIQFEFIIFFVVSDEKERNVIYK